MNGRCIIITSYLETTIRASVEIRPDDYIICADGGFKYAFDEALTPDVIIGDFDSYSYTDFEEILKNNSKLGKIKIVRTQPEKDYTDTHMCVNYGIEKGFSDFIIVGGLGGRLDHTVANLQLLSCILDDGGSGWIMDGNNKATMIQGSDELELKPDDLSYFSVYSFTEECTGVYEINAKYPLTNATLNQSFPIGTSNEFLGGPSTIKIGKGKLLIVLSPK